MSILNGLRWSQRLKPAFQLWAENAVWRSSLSTATVSRKQHEDISPGEERATPRRLDPAQADTLMDIGIRQIFNEDHDLLRTNIRRFMQEELKPRHRDWELRGYVDHELFQKVCDAGIACLNLPTEDYGQGGNIMDSSILWDELGYANVSVSDVFCITYDVVPHYLRHYGTQEQKDKYLKGLGQGGMVAAIAMTEPDAGSDLQGIKSNAKQDGDDWILNGSKMFITGGQLCDFSLVVANTNREAKHAAHGLSMFIVDADTPGFTKGKILKKLGGPSTDTTPLYFDDVRLPKSALLGEANRAFEYMMVQLPQERICAAGGKLGLAENMFEMTRDYVRQRKAFGRPLANLQVIQHKLAELKTYICTTRAFFDQCLMADVAGQLDSYTASMAKYWCTEMSMNVGNECVQLHGGTGYMEESEICRAYTWSRVGPIYAGTNEIMKELISRKIVKG